MGAGGKGHRGRGKLTGVERARYLKHKGYIVLPDPDDPAVQEVHHR